LHTPTDIFPYAVFLIGLCVGSFCNVVIYRLPAGGSLCSPARSYCPLCKEPIAAYFNIPILGYILLLGKCRHCKGPISLRYPVVELSVGLLFLASYHLYGFPLFLIYAAWLTSFVVITFIDLDHQIIPDLISLPGIVYGLAFSALGLIPVAITDSLAGALLGGALFYLIAILSRGGMGGGDIKFIAMIGSFLGWQKVLLTIFLSSLAGSIVGILLMALGKKGRKSKIPYGPFLALGAVISLFWGDRLIYLYLHHIIYE